MENHLQTILRRKMLLLTTVGLVGCDWLHAGASSGTSLDDEDKRLERKFRGLKGGELRVDALFEANGVNIFDDTGRLFFSSALLSPRRNAIRSYSAKFGVPKTLRVEWRDRYQTAFDPPMPPPPGHVTDAFYGGTVLGSYTVPVASRIPDDLLDAMREGVGGFGLKIRIHPDGPLVGWELSRGFNLQYFAGGDFREADIENGKVLRKGWYIHPKTGQKIETDF
jgi:hypothetical protein